MLGGVEPRLHSVGLEESFRCYRTFGAVEEVIQSTSVSAFDLPRHGQGFGNQLPKFELDLPAWLSP